MQLIDNFVNAINNALVHRYPYLHLQLSECFGSEDYAEMQCMLPPLDCYSYLMHPDAMTSSGTSTRRQLSLAPKSLARLDRLYRVFWSEVSRQLQSEEVKAAFIRKLYQGLMERFRSPDKIEAYPCPALNRDESGYSIAPHPDIMDKVISVLVYLPQTNDRPELGTEIYEQVDETSFVAIRSIPYVPNSGLAFAVSKFSFHGRPTLPSGVVQRDSLALTYYKNRDERGY